MEEEKKDIEADSHVAASEVSEKKDANTPSQYSTAKKIFWMSVGFFIVIGITLGYGLLRRSAELPSTQAGIMADGYNKYYGTLEGSLSYPSDFIPDMQVCATNKSTKESFCTLELLESNMYKNGYGYVLEVPTGSYSVYAQLVDTSGKAEDTYKAYYTKYVTCGMDSDCTSHKRITVQVQGGETYEHIDPMDWYIP